MHLIEFLLPTFDSSGQRFARSEFDLVRQELHDHFGDVTAFVRTPAVGVWTDEADHVRRNEVARFEVTADKLDRVWWRDYRALLERRVHQQAVVIRATTFDRL